ncbi:MAG: SMC-Scp complex subunit ScpB [Candidatus Paceibacterota bacterium]|jgi:segregation and condensation protein B
MEQNPTDLPISAKIEAVLFCKAEPMSKKKLSTLLGVDESSLQHGLETLREALSGRGISLVETNEDVMLGTAKELAGLIEQFTKDELSENLGKAGLETLSIVLYQGPISRTDIDHIRGVNSQFILRNLLVRGLVERIENPSDTRSFLYKPSLDLLAHLGISKIEDLPSFAQVRSDIDSFKKGIDNTNEGKNSKN